MQLKAVQPNFAGCCQFSGALTDKAKAGIQAFKTKAANTTVGQKVAQSPAFQKVSDLTSRAYEGVAAKLNRSEPGGKVNFFA